MNSIVALHALGVRKDTLTAEQKKHLDTEGYLHLKSVLSAGEVEAFRARLAELQAAEGDLAGTEVHQEAGTDRLSDLVNKGPMFGEVLRRRKVLAAVAHVLYSDIKLSSLNSRSALPGHGLQALHADWGKLETAGDYQVCNSIWLLDDFTPDNGATRLVPGSHLLGTTVAEAMDDPKLPHPDEVLLLGKAGDVIVFNAHVWHGGTLNVTDKPRRAMHGYFTRRNRPQQLDQKAYLKPETAAALRLAELVLLGVEGD
jgi:ectoine hydroxylase-related dioxygenase (phytanoyl-CoA dioxygenase family)